MLTPSFKRLPACGTEWSHGILSKDAWHAATRSLQESAPQAVSPPPGFLVGKTGEVSLTGRPESTRRFCPQDPAALDLRGIGQVLPTHLMEERLIRQQQEMEEDQRWLEKEERFLVTAFRKCPSTLSPAGGCGKVPLFQSRRAGFPSVPETCGCLLS